MITATEPRTWSTREVGELLGRPPRTVPQRLFPHPVHTPGSGYRLRHTRVDVAGALIFQALDPEATRGRPAWHRTLACILARLAAGDHRPWVLVFPHEEGADWRLIDADGAAIPAALADRPGPGVLVLFLDRILAPLDEEARRHG